MFYFSDTQVRGGYSNKARKLWEARGVQLKTEPEDEQILREGCVDYVGFSYYMSAVSSTRPVEKVQGNMMRMVKNPYVQESDWGWGLIRSACGSH